MSKDKDSIMWIVFWIGVAVLVLCLIWFIVEIVRYNMILDEFEQSAKLIKDGKMFF